MKKSSIVAAASLLVALASSTCFAAVSAGENEVSVSGSYISSKPEGGDSSDTIFIRGGMGHYLTDNFSFGGDLLVTGTSSDTSDSTTLLANINAKFYLNPKGTVIPFVGAQLGYQTTDSTFESANAFGPTSQSSTTTGYSYGIMGGIKFFMSENASFDVELNYRTDTLSADESTEDFTQTTTALLLGLTYYFGK